MARWNVSYIPFHSTMLDHELLSNWGNGLILGANHVRASTVIERVRPSWRPTRVSNAFCDWFLSRMMACEANCGEMSL